LQHPFFFGPCSNLSLFRLKLSPFSNSVPVARLGLTKPLKAPLETYFLYMILAALSNNYPYFQNYHFNIGTDFSTGFNVKVPSNLFEQLIRFLCSHSSIGLQVKASSDQKEHHLFMAVLFHLFNPWLQR
jgi:hypothetical protein